MSDLSSQASSLRGQPTGIEATKRPAGSLTGLHRRLRTSSWKSLTTEQSVSNVDSLAKSKGSLGLTLIAEPSEPRVDLILVHGLGGGSRKTWSDSPDQSSFWPQAWLPAETGFKNVRIHSYGYNSDWASQTKSQLTIQDFGQALLADVHNSPELQKNGDTPIIFMAHSMGGLVVKKAYLLATRDPMYHKIADRTHSIYFLATPHRGADSAQLLSRVLSASVSGSKAFVNELFPGSGTLQAVNDEFRHVCKNLQLWSFFEGAPTKVGMTSTMIVSRDSSVMGLPGEHTQYLDADHRHVCKFDSHQHPNYLILKKCLLSSIKEIEIHYNSQRYETLQSEMKLISKFLKIDQRPSVELQKISEKQHPGTCTWLTTHPTFHQWYEEDWAVASLSSPKQAEYPTARFLWLNGAPGSGKSVASGHVIRHLEHSNLDCSHYFVRHGNREMSTISTVLRYIAFQMAELNFDVRKAILNMIHNDERLDPNDHGMIWSSVFMARILKMDFSSPQFWVIDAIDECASKGASNLLQMFAKIPPSVRIRIFISSRPSSKIQGILAHEKSPVCVMETGRQESLDDIATLIRSRRYERATGQDLSESLIAEILAKSNGIFLWASLIMTRLEETYSEEDMHDVLHQLPSEMDDLYQRISDTIAESQSYELAKCILKWTVCASVSRRMSTHEIREAVKLDVDRTLTASDDRLSQLCGDLIFVDRDSQVQIIHQTVASFLTQHESALRIDQASDHARLAEICLLYLTSKDFMPPRARRGPIALQQMNHMTFADYAGTYFSHHLAHSSSAVDAPLILLGKFLSCNVLTWIARVATQGSLDLLVKTVQNIRSYLARRAKHRSPLGMEFQLAEAWATDLVHIVSSFGNNLLDSPSSIFFLIPMLSPPASNIHRLFTKDTRQVKLFGRSAEQDWDDRISCLLHDCMVTSVAACLQVVAVGLSNGMVLVYNSVTLELLARLEHGEVVRLQAFGKTSSCLAICGARKISFWSARRACVWSVRLRHTRTPVSLSFSEEEDQLLLPGKDGQIALYSTEDGTLLETFPLYHSSDSESDDDEMKVLPGTPPSLVRICVPHGLVGVTYRNSPVHIWDSSRRQKIGTFQRPGTEDTYCQPQVLDMAFNPLPDLELLAVAYDQVGIVICDPWALEQLSVCKTDAKVLAASPDGRILASGDYSGVITIFAFESTLRIMYQITALDQMIRGIVFSPTSTRFYDMRGSFCNIWEPPVLVRRETFDDTSSNPQSEELLPAVPEMAFARPLRDKEYICCLIALHDNGTIFCGRRNGVISIYDAKTGERTQDLQLFETEYSIKHLRWSPASHTLLAIDSVNHCLIVRLASKARGSWSVEERVADHFVISPVEDVLFNADGNFYLLVTLKADELWNVQGQLRETISSVGESRKWVTDPAEAGRLLLLHGNVLHIYEWITLQRLTPDNGIPASLAGDIFSMSGDWVLHRGFDSLIKTGRLDDQRTGFILIDVSALQHDSTEAPTQCVKKGLENHVRQVLGLHKSSLLFLDSKGWICSVSKSLSNAEDYKRHFFIPQTWMVETDLLISIVGKNSIALVRRDELAVFHGFLDYEEKVLFRRGQEPDS